MSSLSSHRVFAAYRRLFRARKSLFQKDTVALDQSRLAIRQEFVNNAQAPASQLDLLLHMAEEAEDMMRHGIVQGELNAGTGNYEVKVQPQHVEGELPLLEPITNNIVHKLTEPDEVNVTTTTTRSSSSASDASKK